MNSPYKEITGALLLAFGAYWLLSAAATKPAIWEEGKASSLLHSHLWMVGFALICVKRLRVGILALRFIPQSVFI